MENFDQEVLKNLQSTFGAQKVREVIDIVNMSDPDGAWSTFQDFEDEDACSIIEALYFEQD